MRWGSQKQGVLPPQDAEYSFRVLFQQTNEQKTTKVCVYWGPLTRYVAKNFAPLSLIERNPPPRGGFLFTMFPHQEP